MKRRRPFTGWVVIVLVVGLSVFIWSDAKRLNVDSNLGLIDTIRAVGDGIARRMGRG